MALTKASFSMIDGIFLNVKDYGAIGDGVADDTAAIQAALTAAESTIFNADVGRGKTVFFPTGLYKITSTLNLGASHCTLLGEGPRSSSIVYEPATGTALYAAAGLVSFNIKSLDIRGSLLGNTHTSGWGLHIVGPARFNTFDDVNVSGFANGIHIESGWYITLRHVQSFGAYSFTSGSIPSGSTGTIGFKFGRAVAHDFTGNGSTTSFDPNVSDTDWVTIDGVFQSSSAYSIVGTAVVFNTAPASGAKIRILTGFGGATTVLLDQCYIANYETNVYNTEVSGLEFNNLIMEWCVTGLKTELWAMGSVYCEQVYTDAIEAYMPVKIKCINNRSFWYRAGATDNIYRNACTEQSSLVDELNRPPATVAYLASARTITESIAASGLIIWDKLQDGANSIQSDGKINCPGREGWYRLSGTLQISQMTSGDDVAAQIAVFNAAGSVSLIERLRVVASGTENFNYIKLEKIAYLAAGSSFGIFIGSNDNTLALQGQTVGGGNRQSWVSVERLAY